MKRKKILIAACLTATLGGTFAFAAHTTAAASWLGILTAPQPMQSINAVTARSPQQNTSVSLTNLPTTSQTSSPQEVSAPAVPPQIVYHFFFRRIQLLEQKAQELDTRGENGAAVRNLYQQKIGLTDEQNAFLLTTAVDCMNEVRATDNIAAPIIEQLTAAYQNQPFSPAAPPPASDQLIALQNQREQIVLSHRDLLRNNFGDEMFARLEEFVTEKISSNIQSNVSLQSAAAPSTSRTSTAPPSAMPGNLIQPNDSAPKENK